MSIPQQINFTVNLVEGNGTKTQQKATLNFSLDSLIIPE